MSLVLLLGGARSGKSSLSLQLASAHAGRGCPQRAEPVTFIATGEPKDAEMAARIEAHRSGRPKGWVTVEEPLHVEHALAGCHEDATVVVDCLTLWVANMLEAGTSDEVVLKRASEASALASRRKGLVVAVSNEVGSGIVPASPLSRRYRDLLGSVNQMFAADARAAYLVVAGRLLSLARPAEALGLCAEPRREPVP